VYFLSVDRNAENLEPQEIEEYKSSGKNNNMKGCEEKHGRVVDVCRVAQVLRPWE
jgi:hypothetical protein